MGYQLAFWQCEVGRSPDSRSTFDALMNGGTVDGVVSLPTEQIIGAILAAFPTAVREPNGPSSEWIDWTSEGGRASFQIEWSPTHVLAELRPLDNDVANALIDVMAGFRCPLFDPQTGERFDSSYDT